MSSSDFDAVGSAIGESLLVVLPAVLPMTQVAAARVGIELSVLATQAVSGRNPSVRDLPSLYLYTMNHRSKQCLTRGPSGIDKLWSPMTSSPP